MARHYNSIKQGRGRPRESVYTQPPPNAEQSLSFWIRRQREDFLAQPERVRAETVARVELILESERALWLGRPEGRRGTPSQLARTAFRVYGIWLEWLPAQYQVEQSTKLDDDRELLVANTLRAVLGEVV